MIIEEIHWDVNVVPRDLKGTLFLPNFSALLYTRIIPNIFLTLYLALKMLIQPIFSQKETFVTKSTFM